MQIAAAILMIISGISLIVYGFPATRETCKDIRENKTNLEVMKCS